MSILQKLTEGVQTRNMQAEGAALLNKWEATGLLEGLDGQRKQGMAVLLENQAKELLREASSMAAGDVEGFAAVAFPIVRRVFGGLIAQDLISVQPMSLPSGLIFFLDFTHSDGRSGFGQDTSLYGGGVVGKNIIDGVKDIAETGFYGLRSGYAAATGSVASGGDIAASLITLVSNPEASSDLDFDPDLTGKQVIMMKPEAADWNAANLALLDPGLARAIQPDPASSPETNGQGPTFNNFVVGTSQDAGCIVVDDGAIGSIGGVASLAGDLVVAVKASGAESMGGQTLADNDVFLVRLRQQRRLTEVVTANNADGLKAISNVSRLVFTVESAQWYDASSDGATDLACATLANVKTIVAREAGHTTVAVGAVLGAQVAAGLGEVSLQLAGPVRDDISSSGLGALTAGAMPLEEPGGATGKSAADRTGKNDIAEIDIKVDSVAVTAQTKKLKAKWSPELGQDLNAYHNLDAEVELTGILSEQIALEIDRELLAELVDGASAGTRYWSRAPGLFVNSSGAEIGASSAAS